VAEEEELLEQLEEQFKQLKVSDLLVQTVVGLSSLGYRSLGEENRDLEQARLAIEALRALVPVLEGSVPEQTTRDFQQLVSNMQLAYAAASPARRGPTS
jgi:SpoVK/Ycf46/Vps4 family AAA+-type ATPase